ncbi:hypothetical protein BDN70DRAFT_919338 [Pholiota conissans]|uniref:Uncharacterized protein n=1 Tax=Pholiota conissans TaxID=109636 RepID=A0A9P6D3I1_9AGAR|nr:hypothetical protein BDN70DRAFT_919338 [Pholiota conissans]
MIHDLQYYALASMNIIGIGAPCASQCITTIGLRCAVEKRVHQRKPTSPQKPTVEGELQKCLIFVDRIAGAYLGRPYAVQDENYDVDYPIECDDEYWKTDDPGQAFQQLPEKPTLMTAFVRMLKLFKIMAFALKTLYSTRKSKVLAGPTGAEWDSESRRVASLRSWIRLRIKGRILFPSFAGNFITGSAISLILWRNKRSECAKSWRVAGRAYYMLNEVSFTGEYKSTLSKHDLHEDLDISNPPSNNAFPQLSSLYFSHPDIPTHPSLAPALLGKQS